MGGRGETWSAAEKLVDICMVSRSVQLCDRHTTALGDVVDWL